MSEEAKPLCHTCRLPFEPSHPSWRKHDTRADCIDALRAALDKERADNAKARAEIGALRAFAWVMYEEGRGDPYGEINSPWILDAMAEKGLVDGDWNPTALLTGRPKESPH